jgi:hypothetical protein
MSEEKPEIVLGVDLEDGSDHLRFASPQELEKWNETEFAKWAWLGQGQHSQAIYQHHLKLRNQLQQFASNWKTNLAAKQPPTAVFKNLIDVFRAYYEKRLIFNSTSPAGSWLLDLNQKEGPIIAVGAYFALLGKDLGGLPINQYGLIDGLIQGFLYTREIKWTATAHHKALMRLKKEYEDNILLQATKSQQIEELNKSLNTSFSAALEERTARFDKLIETKDGEFQNLAAAHVEQLKSIEHAYDQKLALQKPVEYWGDKERSHKIRARWFGVATVLAGAGVSAGLILLALLIFAGVPSGQNPSHFEIGVLGTAVFFSVWFVRIIVRLFFSHHHLATDAAERRMMILTYLSLVREGTQYAPEDRTLILQNLFRAASDGLVKDDAAPPTLIGELTRRL